MYCLKSHRACWLLSLPLKYRAKIGYFTEIFIHVLTFLPPIKTIFLTSFIDV